MIALADCNNFYASCERVFNPGLIGQPVVVLSNNDGCVISRSEEAKKLGIKMAVPAYQIEKLIIKNQVKVFSSNYALYGDLSNRVMNTLAGFTPSLEIYSIDESFLDFSFLPPAQAADYARQIRRTLLKNIGIPVSIGIGPTKTLAKVANKIAKKQGTGGVFVFETAAATAEYLQKLMVDEVWGIGRQHAAWLHANKIHTAYDFSRAPAHWVKKHLSVTGLRTKDELCGISCIDLEEFQSRKKTICTSRSFGQPQSQLEPLTEAVATFTMKCAEKLRHQHSAATELMVFILTNPFRSELPQYSPSRVIRLPVATNDSLELVKHATTALKAIYREGYLFKKAGVIVMGLIPENEVQLNLFSSSGTPQQRRLMETIDRLNRHYGSDTIQLAAQGTKRKWKLRQERLSPRYTTNWKEILVINVGNEKAPDGDNPQPPRPRTETPES